MPAERAAENYRRAYELLIDLLPYFWVDQGVVREMARLLLKNEPPRSTIALIADQSATGRDYVRCAAARAPLETWSVFECTPSFSHEDGIHHVVLEILEQANEALPWCMQPDPAEPDDELIGCWQEHIQDSGPLVVLFPQAFSEIGRTFFDELSAKLRRLNFIVLCPEQEPDRAGRLTSVVLIPEHGQKRRQADGVFRSLERSLNPEPSS